MGRFRFDHAGQSAPCRPLPLTEPPSTPRASCAGRPQECHIDLQKIARFANATLVHTEATGIDSKKRLIHCKDGRPPIRYDVLSIDIGSTPRFVESLVSAPRCRVRIPSRCRRRSFPLVH